MCFGYDDCIVNQTLQSEKGIIRFGNERERGIGMKCGYWIDNEIRAYIGSVFVDDMLSAGIKY